jgi:phosphatidate cytidylyltransferase
MLRTRLWMGAVLIGLAVGMLVVDQHLMPWAPFLFVFVVGLGLLACIEMIALLGPNRSVQAPIIYVAIVALGIASWVPHTAGIVVSPWLCVLGTLSGLVLAVFVFEMARFTEAGDSVERMARTIWVIAYLGLLPGFFAQLRWLGGDNPSPGTAALALAIFVPKMCDSGAYFTGRLLGRHKMTPVLSPKKTWEGTIGGLVGGALTAILIDRLGPAAVLQENLALEIGFGITVSVAGILGDLAESLIKRDCQKKDASQIMPGFGGVLDVVDSVIFAAPVVYVWLLSLAA